MHDANDNATTQIKQDLKSFVHVGLTSIPLKETSLKIDANFADN